MTITIRPPQNLNEYDAIEQLQAEIWGPGSGIVPTHMLLTFAKEGGNVLLLLDNTQPIGFAFGFPGLTDKGEIKLASHQAGVLPPYQNRGLGYKIKLAQRDFALSKNLSLITWTFDPLQSLNARFNLHKLGAVCNTYIPNLYGELTDELNRGLPSDRFRVDWWISSSHVTTRLAGGDVELNLSAIPVLNPADTKNELLVPLDNFDLPGNETNYLVEIPSNLNTLKTQSPNLALQWRLQTREIFQQAFDAGYTAIDLLRNQNRSYYLLQKNWQPD